MLCIDHTSVGEQNVEVGMTSRIFGQAREMALSPHPHVDRCSNDSPMLLEGAEETRHAASDLYTSALKRLLAVLPIFWRCEIEALKF